LHLKQKNPEGFLQDFFCLTQVATYREGEKNINAKAQGAKKKHLNLSVFATLR